ncbi:oxidoreductase [Enterococcus sp. JM4C]|nr:oxidoreductase [Enterococcus sp. JM4C]
MPGKYTVITGASSGIGYAAAKEFAKRGKNLLLIARRIEKLNALKSELANEYPGVEVILVQFDLTETDKLEELFLSLSDYEIETWINNAGVGLYSLIENQTIEKTVNLIKLNIEALTLFSILFVKKYNGVAGTQLINVSSAGGYTMVPTAVTYCASKFYVSSFTESLALELRASNSPLQVKVLAPAATQTEFGKRANDVEEYNYDKAFGTYHSSQQVAEFLLELYDSKQIVGLVDRTSFELQLSEALFPYAGSGARNQKI